MRPGSPPTDPSPEREREGEHLGTPVCSQSAEKFQRGVAGVYQRMFSHRDQTEGAMLIYETISLRGYARNQYSSCLRVWELENWVRLERGLISMV